MNISVEQYDNLFELVKQILNFYANAENYNQEKDKLFSTIQLDGGYQARFLISKIKELQETNKKMEDEIIKSIKNEDDIKKTDIITLINYFNKDGN